MKTQKLLRAVVLLVLSTSFVLQSAWAQDAILPDTTTFVSPLSEIDVIEGVAGSSMMSYQGVLTQGAELVDGTVDLTFAIYTAASGGTALWTESKTVTASDGVFETELGDTTPITLPFDAPYYIGVTVGTDSEMTPRTLLTAAPYAFTAAAIQGKPVGTTNPAAGQVLKWSGTEWAPSDDNAGSSIWNTSGSDIFFNNGDVGIGTSSVDAKFEVYQNSSLSDPHVLLHENGNDYARLNFKNNNGSNYWSVAAYIASNHRNDRLNFWNGVGGDVMTITGDGEVGIGVGISPKVPFHVGNGRRVLFGVDTLGSGDKLMFLPDLHAFRVGTVATGAASTYWNRDSTGLYSFASGYNTRAQGFGATAMGRDTEATNSYAFASGFFTNADGQYSTAMGFNTDAFALGSTALGYSTDAEQNYSFAAGYFAEAQAIYSVAIGNAVRAQSYASMAVGRYNVGGGNASSWVTSDPIFEIGIGTGPSSRANAMTVRKNGNVGIGTTAPADPLHVVGKLRVGSVETVEDVGTFQLEFNASLLPSSDNVRDLGTSAQRWDDVFATNGTIQTSDGRLKTNVETIPSVVDRVMALRPVTFAWIGDETSQTRNGLIAQEVLNVFPEVVNTTDEVYDEETGESTLVPAANLGINYTALIPKLIKAMQEQQAMIDALRQQVTALQGQN